MKKSKKLSLQSLALVLMSFILVAGVAFGMTGAWFTNKASEENKSIALGNGVKAVLTGAFGECNNEDSLHGDEQYMPGCKVNFTGDITAAADSSEFRIRMKVVVTGVEAGKIVLSKVKVGTAQTEVTAGAVSGDGAAAWAYLPQTLKGGDDALDYTATLEFVGKELDNTYIKANVTVSVYIEIIQAAHTENTEAFWETTDGGVTAVVRDNITVGGEEA